MTAHSDPLVRNSGINFAVFFLHNNSFFFILVKNNLPERNVATRPAVHAHRVSTVCLYIPGGPKGDASGIFLVYFKRLDQI